MGNRSYNSYAIACVWADDKHDERSLIHLVNHELYDWGELKTDHMTSEEAFRLDGSIKLRWIRKEANGRGNMIWRWLVYGSPSFKEYENPVCENELQEVVA